MSNTVYAIVSQTKWATHSVDKILCLISNEEAAISLADTLNKYKKNIEVLAEVYNENKKLYDRLQMKEKMFFRDGVKEVKGLSDIFIIPLPIIGLVYEPDYDIETIAEKILFASVQAGYFIWPANL